MSFHHNTRFLCVWLEKNWYCETRGRQFGFPAPKWRETQFYFFPNSSYFRFDMFQVVQTLSQVVVTGLAKDTAKGNMQAICPRTARRAVIFAADQDQDSADTNPVYEL